MVSESLLNQLPFGATPLIAAVGRNDRAAIDALLDAGADINARSNWWAGGFGVLDSCTPDLAPYLIQRGARVDAHAAARLDMIDALRKLVADNPDIVHARGGDGKTPLHVAATTEIADLLLEHGADIDAEDIDHESTPAQHLIGEHPDVARHLVRRGARTDILLASALGDESRVSEHVARNPEHIRMRVNDTWFPMRDPRAGGIIYRWTLGYNVTGHTVARAHGHTQFDELMQRTPDDLALLVACDVGDDALVHTLIARNPALISELRHEDLQQIVVMAELRRSDAVLRMLALRWPADVRVHHGQTALHWAAFHGDLEAVRALKVHGASENAAETQFGGRPANWAEHGRAHSWFRHRGDYNAVMNELVSGPVHE